MGQSRHSNLAPTTSDLPRSADIFRVPRHVSKVRIGDVALMFKKREAANLGGLRYVFGQNLGLGQWAVVR